MRILGTVLFDEHEKWAAGKRCFEMTGYYEHISNAVLDSADEALRKDVA